MIQVVWGNKVVLFSKRINKRNVYDKKLDIYERCCTFDGADHYSENGNKNYKKIFLTPCPPFPSDFYIIFE